MKESVAICCFCDKVKEKTQDEPGPGRWQELESYMGSHKLKRENLIATYSCCAACLKEDPHAVAFRTRSIRSQSLQTALA